MAGRRARARLGTAYLYWQRYPAPDTWQVRVVGQLVSAGPVQAQAHSPPTLDCRHWEFAGVAGQGAATLQGCVHHPASAPVPPTAQVRFAAQALVAEQARP